jgi:hypothetical protein
MAYDFGEFCKVYHFNPFPHLLSSVHPDAVWAVKLNVFICDVLVC